MELILNRVVMTSLMLSTVGLLTTDMTIRLDDKLKEAGYKRPVWYCLLLLCHWSLFPVSILVLTVAMVIKVWI